MLGILMGIVNKVRPYLTNYRIESSEKGFDFFTTKPHYGMGLKPDFLGNKEILIATLSIDATDDGFEIAADSGRIRKQFLATVPNSGRISTANGTKGWVYDWRLDEVAKEIADFIKSVS